MMNDDEATYAARAKWLGGLDLTTWGLDATDPLDHISLGDLVRKAATEALRLAMKDKATVSFPIEWSFGNCDGRNRPPVFDPDVIYFEVPLGFDDLESAEWGASLRECIEQFIDGTSSTSGQIADIHVPAAEAMRDHLKAMAGLIDDALKGRAEPAGESDKIEKT